MLPNNNSSIQFTRLHNGHLALVFNDMGMERASERHRSLCDNIEDNGAGHERPAPDEELGNRAGPSGEFLAPLTLAISQDEGQTWPKKRNLKVGDGYCMTNSSRKE